MEKKILTIDNIDRYNQQLGVETKHPLVTVLNLKDAPNREMIDSEATFRYEVYALFLKNTRSCILNYGHRPYDYSDGTVTSFAPGQVVQSKPIPGMDSDVEALLFHPDLVRGTSLAQTLKDCHFFDYTSNEALHMSAEERRVFCDALAKIKTEVERPIDKHSRRLICSTIELLLEYCLRFYDRQFITREFDNRNVLIQFEKELSDYFKSKTIFLDGLPSVKYFAERCFLSPNYFGDLVKKETGKTPQEYIQAKVTELAKDMLTSTQQPISQIAYKLGFEYSQHFNRYFKRMTGMTPTEYRLKHSA